MLVFVASAWADRPTPEPPAAPILEWADRDLRSLAGARVALLAAVAGPALFYVGDDAAASASGRTGDVQRVVGLALETAGVLGSAVGPPVLLLEVGRSRGALRAQDLTVESTGLALAAGLWVAAVGATAAIGAGGPVTDRPVAIVPVAAAYSGAVGLGLAQLSANHAARRDAGWLGIAPTGQGLVVVGAW